MSKNPNQVITLKAVEYIRLIPTGFLVAIKWLSLALWLSAAGVLLAYFFPPLVWMARLIISGLPASIDWNLWRGVFLVALSMWALCVLILAFARQKLTRLGKQLGKKGGGRGNVLEYFDFDAARIFKRTLPYSHLPFEKLLLYYILMFGDLSFSLNRLGIDKADLKKKLLAGMRERSKSFSREDEKNIKSINEERRRQIFDAARRIVLETGGGKITIYSLFLALSDSDQDFQKIMDALGILKEDVETVVLWQARRRDYQEFRAKFWERDNLRLALGGSPAMMAVGGYTTTLDAYARDIFLFNPLRQGGVVLHSQEIEKMEAVLTKKKESGVLLVGEAGGGRKSVIYNFANRVLAESGPKALKMLRIMEVDIPKMAGDFLDKSLLAAAMERIFFEAAKAKNVVLVIPEISNYLGVHFDSEKLVQMDMSDILGKYLEVEGFRVIGITDHQGLRRSVELAPAIAGKLAKIELAPVSSDDALRVLKEESLRREAKTGLTFRFCALKEIVRLCDYFSGDIAFPKKAVNLLDDLVADRLARAGAIQKVITAPDAAVFFSRKYGIPAGAAGIGEKDVLLNLEDRIHEGLINQHEAVSEIANAMRRSRATFKKQNRTIGNFLFLGPTGCGKTETAKQLARVYFGSEKNMIRLNMAEYQTAESIEKLIGDSRTPGYLTAAVRENPFSLLLIDEIEKADTRLLDVFLSIFDEGQVADGFGRIIDFRHIIAIATSNAGADYIKEAVDRGGTLANLKESFVDNLLRRHIFKPEFLNRFDAIVLYRPLNIGEMRQVAGLMLKDIVGGLKQKRIELEVGDELLDAIVKIGFDPAFGGRALRRAVQDKVENILASAILSEKIKAGDVCAFDCQNWRLLVNDERFSSRDSLPAADQDLIAQSLINLEDRVHERLINQHEAVSEVANAMRRAHANLKECRRTIGNFLFLGPTGCGKTETAKQLARVYFGSEKNMVRLNMAEYQNINSLDKLIGNLQSPGLLTSRVIERPQSLILIDEIEKASPQILNLFLSIFDDGQLTDGLGRLIDFKNTIIIATSNAGAADIREAIQGGVALDGQFKKKLFDRLLQEGIFAPEFVNRFDATALYRPLDRQKTKQVASLMLDELRRGLAKKEIEFSVTDELLEALTEIGFDPEFGGRALRRAVQDKIENAVAKDVLSRSIKAGDIIEIDPAEWRVKIKNNRVC